MRIGRQVCQRYIPDNFPVHRHAEEEIVLDRFRQLLIICRVRDRRGVDADVELDVRQEDIVPAGLLDGGVAAALDFLLRHLAQLVPRDRFRPKLPLDVADEGVAIDVLVDQGFGQHVARDGDDAGRRVVGNLRHGIQTELRKILRRQRRKVAEVAVRGRFRDFVPLHLLQAGHGDAEGIERRTRPHPRFVLVVRPEDGLRDRRPILRLLGFDDRLFLVLDLVHPRARPVAGAHRGNAGQERIALDLRGLDGPDRGVGGLRAVGRGVQHARGQHVSGHGEGHARRGPGGGDLRQGRDAQQGEVRLGRRVRRAAVDGDEQAGLERRALGPGLQRVIEVQEGGRRVQRAGIGLRRNLHVAHEAIGIPGLGLFQCIGLDRGGRDGPDHGMFRAVQGRARGQRSRRDGKRGQVLRDLHLRQGGKAEQRFVLRGGRVRLPAVDGDEQGRRGIGLGVRAQALGVVIVRPGQGHGQRAGPLEHLGCGFLRGKAGLRLRLRAAQLRRERERALPLARQGREDGFRAQGKARRGDLDPQPQRVLRGGLHGDGSPRGQAKEPQHRLPFDGDGSGLRIIGRSPLRQRAALHMERQRQGRGPFPLPRAVALHGETRGLRLRGKVRLLRLHLDRPLRRDGRRGDFRGQRRRRRDLRGGGRRHSGCGRRGRDLRLRGGRRRGGWF